MIRQLVPLPVLALCALAASPATQADSRIGYHGMFCQPRDAATPVVRDAVWGIRNYSADQVTYDCPMPVFTLPKPASIASARVTYVENSAGNLSCTISTRTTTGDVIAAVQRVAPVGGSPVPGVFDFPRMKLPVDGHALMTCSVPPDNLTTDVPSGIISYSVTQN